MPPPPAPEPPPPAAFGLPGADAEALAPGAQESALAQSPPRSGRFADVRLSPTVIGPRTRARLRFTLTTATRVQLSVERRMAGRRRPGSSLCERRTSRNARNRLCTYFVPLPGRRLVTGRADSNQVAVTTTFAGTVLTAGAYRLTLRTSTGERSQLAFTVVRR